MKQDKLLKIKEGALIEVLWMDAFSKHGWFDVDGVKQAIDEMEPTRSVGYFVTAHKDKMVIAMSLDTSFGVYGNFKAIPMSQIVKVEK